MILELNQDMLGSLAVEIQEKIKNQFIKVLIDMNNVIAGLKSGLETITQMGTTIMGNIEEIIRTEAGLKTKLQGLNQTIAQVRFFDR